MNRIVEIIKSYYEKQILSLKQTVEDYRQHRWAKLWHETIDMVLRYMSVTVVVLLLQIHYDQTLLSKECNYAVQLTQYRQTHMVANLSDIPPPPINYSLQDFMLFRKGQGHLWVCDKGCIP